MYLGRRLSKEQTEEIMKVSYECDLLIVEHFSIEIIMISFELGLENMK